MPDLRQSQILITRPEGKAEAMADLVRQWNGVPVIFPTISIAEPADWSVVDDAINRLTEYDWIVFSSVQGVKYFCDRALSLLGDLKSCWTVKVAVVGQKTADALREKQIAVDLIPQNFTSENLVEAFQSIPLENKKILYVTGDKGRQTIITGLPSQGAALDRVNAYRNVLPEVLNFEETWNRIKSHSVDYFTFTSPSTYQNLYDIILDQDEEPETFFKSQTAVAIGPVTAEALRASGFSRVLVASESTIEGILNIIAETLTTENSTVLE